MTFLKKLHFRVCFFLISYETSGGVKFYTSGRQGSVEITLLAEVLLFPSLFMAVFTVTVFFPGEHAPPLLWKSPNMQHVIEL